MKILWHWAQKWEQIDGLSKIVFVAFFSCIDDLCKNSLQDRLGFLCVNS